MSQFSYVERSAAGTSVAFQEALWRVFFWMAFGLGTTALVAMVVASSEPLREAVLGNSLVFFLCIIAQFAMVIALSTMAQRLPATGAITLFLAYSALSGVTFAVVFLVYTKESIASTFFITAGTFAAVGLFGATTKRDLSNVGALAFMGLIGFIIASVVNIFLRSELLMWITTYAGVAIFVGLTAYDMQKIKQSAATLTLEGPDRDRWAVSWALRLYLDFINLFLLLLRIFGNRR